ncbi:MAG: histidinol-phosphate transaminase [Alistipes sp.]|jgi:histidinol-phosphate aminotransferase|nr:histidinol-phosphate transaminase [Alistipes sp.]
MNPLDLVRRNIRSLTPYSTARDEYQGGPLGVFLDANENPYPEGRNFNRYPDPAQRAIKQRLSEIKGVPADRIFVGNGSDEAIDLAFRIFCEPGRDNAVAIAPTYGMYRVSAGINDVEMREVQLRSDFSLDTTATLSAADERTKLLFLCSPNNPSGNLFPRTQIVELLERFSGMVVLDEAYIDFASEPGFLHELEKYPNLIILQTLSKAWGMAGLRLGLAFGAPEVMELFARVKYPYNISAAVQGIVAEKLRDTERVAAQIAEIVSERARVVVALEASPAIARVFPSSANFVLVKTTGDPRTMYDKLIAAGIIVRDRSRIAGCEGMLRITIGTPEENDKLIATI